MFRWPVFAWAAWDLGSAAFNAVVTTFVFTVYLISDGTFTDSGTASEYLSYGMTAAGIIIALLAPITGQRADRRGHGTLLLGVNTFGVVLCMVGMFWVYPGSVLGPMGALWMGIFLLGLGNVFFEFASVNYNAMLGRISTNKNMGTISGIGWGSGYVGGIILLFLLLFAFLGDEPHWFGVTGKDYLNIRVSILTAALWFALSALPVLFTIRGRKYESVEADESHHESIFDSYRLLWGTIKSLYHSAPQTVLFLAASALFRDGLAGVFIFGAVIAKTVFGFSNAEILKFAILANVIAGVATYAFGWIEDRIGPKRVIVIALSAMIFCGLVVFFFHSSGSVIFWSFGLALTAFVGPAQSASRAFLGRLIPEGREGEVFGLYATTGRAVSFLAPAMYGLFLAIGKLYTGQATGYEYWGILGVILILILGLLVLLPVKPERAHLNHH
ncbi:MFS transporter [Actinomycetaceae bacterium TAE3-ERU4]|nr:MFS transporter [Actinomycetaceae bacterium TAE3-ERU4]